MAILGVEGFSALPRHYVQLCAGFFAFAVSANLAWDLLPRRLAMSFLVGGSFFIDMCRAWGLRRSSARRPLLPPLPLVAVNPRTARRCASKHPDSARERSPQVCPAPPLVGLAASENGAQCHRRERAGGRGNRHACGGGGDGKGGCARRKRPAEACRCRAG